MHLGLLPTWLACKSHKLSSASLLLWGCAGNAVALPCGAVSLKIIRANNSVVHAGMQKLVSACPVLASREEFRRINNLHSIDCISTRLWFDRRVSTQFPANVLGKGFEDATGGTFFNLNDLQVCTFSLWCLVRIYCPGFRSPLQLCFMNCFMLCDL